MSVFGPSFFWISMTEAAILAASPSESIPRALATIASPNIYGYRTKLTPHFDVPPKKAKDGQDDASKKEWELRIGFAEKGRRSVMDIEVIGDAT